MLNSRVKLSVCGKNPSLFVRKLINNNIDILYLNEINYKTIEIIIYLRDYETLLKLKSIYKIKIISYFGVSRLKRIIKKNIVFIISVIISIGIIYCLSNVIFNIEVIHNDSKIRNLIMMELEENGIKKYKLKKDYNRIQKIKEKILNKYKDQLEWIEIEQSGTLVRVRVEERKLTDIEKEPEIRNVVAKKSAIIKNIVAEDGEIVKDINQFVNKGDTVISGEIKLNEEVKNYVAAKGKIYGEVWYKVNISMPLVYNEIKYTGNKKKVYVFKFLNNRIELFNFKKFKDSKIKEKKIIQNLLLPIKFVEENQEEIIKINKKYNEEEAINEAIKLAKRKIENNLKEKEYVIDRKDLKVTLKNSKIELEVFFAVCEDITAYKKINLDSIKQDGD